jgi:hypothetical protein
MHNENAFFCTNPIARFNVFQSIFTGVERNNQIRLINVNLLFTSEEKLRI